VFIILCGTRHEYLGGFSSKLYLTQYGLFHLGIGYGVKSG